jgi:predicted nucleic acid-binding protein
VLSELSTILLGKEIHADAVLLDDFRARQLDKQEGIQVRGSVGLLEALYRRGYLADLRSAFRQLVTHTVYMDRRLLDRRLRLLGIPPL